MDGDNNESTGSRVLFRDFSIAWVGGCAMSITDVHYARREMKMVGARRGGRQTAAFTMIPLKLSS